MTSWSFKMKNVIKEPFLVIGMTASWKVICPQDGLGFVYVWECLDSCWLTLFENYSKCRIRTFLILALSTNFWRIKIDLSGNTVWPQASGFQKLAKMDHFWHFKLTYVHSKCKRSSLRSQCWNETFSVIFKHRGTITKCIFITGMYSKCTQIWLTDMYCLH